MEFQLLDQLDIDNENILNLQKNFRLFQRLEEAIGYGNTAQVIECFNEMETKPDLLEDGGFHAWNGLELALIGSGANAETLDWVIDTACTQNNIKKIKLDNYMTAVSIAFDNTISRVLVHLLLHPKIEANYAAVLNQLQSRAENGFMDDPNQIKDACLSLDKVRILLLRIKEVQSLSPEEFRKLTKFVANTDISKQLLKNLDIHEVLLLAETARATQKRSI